MFREDANNGPRCGRAVIENSRSEPLDLGTLTQKQILPSGVRSAFTASEFV
jgi:hypothetical protein